MGYFNFAYKLMRMFSMLGFFYRRHKKLCKILVIILLFLLTFHYLSVNGYCAQSDADYTTDTSYFILSEYDSLLNTLVRVYDTTYNVDQQSTTAWNDFFDMLAEGYNFYVYKIDNNYYRIYMYLSSQSKTLVDTSLVYNDYLRVPSTAYNLDNPQGRAMFVVSTNYGGFYKNTTATSGLSFTIPYILYLKMPTQINTLMERSGYGNNNSQDTLIDIEDLLNDIDTNGQITNNKLNDINDNLSDMTNEEVEEGVVDIPEVDINDPTESGFNNIYTTIMNHLGYDYSSNHTYWTFTIPFINKNITYMARSYACCF